MNEMQMVDCLAHWVFWIGMLVMFAGLFLHMQERERMEAWDRGKMLVKSKTETLVAPLYLIGKFGFFILAMGLAFNAF